MPLKQLVGQLQLFAHLARVISIGNSFIFWLVLKVASENSFKLALLACNPIKARGLKCFRQEVSQDFSGLIPAPGSSSLLSVNPLKKTKDHYPTSCLNGTMPPP